MNADEILKSAMFKEEYRQMVIVKDIDLYSMCEHHMLPFFGKAHVHIFPMGILQDLVRLPGLWRHFPEGCRFRKD